MLFLDLIQPELMTNQSPVLIFSSYHITIKKGMSALKRKGNFCMKYALSLTIANPYSSLTLPSPPIPVDVA